MDEREFFNETTEQRTHNLVCPKCGQAAEYKSPGSCGANARNCREAAMSATVRVSPRLSPIWSAATTSCNARMSVAASRLRLPRCSRWLSSQTRPGYSLSRGWRAPASL